MSESQTRAMPWPEKSPDEKLRHRLDSWLNRSVAFVSEEAEHAYRTRVQRLIDAVLLEKTPDRVPVPLMVTEFYPLVRAGLSFHDGMYDFERGSSAFVDFNLEFQPDALVSPLIGCLPGPMYDALDYRLYSWPKHGAPMEAYHQYNEREWMLAEDYDALIEDPSDFFFRTYMPRAVGACAGFASLGRLYDASMMVSAASYFTGWAQPEVLDSLEKVVAAGREAAAWATKVQAVLERLQGLGFPPFVGRGPQAPFDLLGDHMRGTRAIAMDLYRRPEKVLAACERLAPLMVRWVVEKSTPETPPCIFWPLHKGDDAHMSEEQFRTFYWPTLRAVALGVIDEGFIPVFFAEGKMDSRLEIIAADMPKGRSVWLLDRTDMAHAKATLGKVAALQGNVPLSLLQVGSQDEVRQYCRRLIEVAAPGGGFLLDSGAVIHHGRDENIRAMIQAAKDYGTY